MRLLDCDFCGAAVPADEADAIVEDGYATLVCCADQAGCLSRMDLVEAPASGLVLA